MKPERWQEVKKVLEVALKRKPADRKVYLDQACSEPSVRREVESLIAAHEQAHTDFLASPADQQKEPAVGDRLGPYEIVATIGAGGMGEVYLARDAKLGRDVAIKVLPAAFARDAERMARFQREAKVLASLNHPNIATIYGLEDSGATYALVMELVEGATLADRIRVGPTPVDEALRIAKQITEALEYAHEHGIMHRDLKPANVKVTNDGRVKVLDFGLAKVFTSDGELDLSDAATLTRMKTEEGLILGTPAYMSPEQARGTAVDKRTDIWAFGCVLYELLTRKRAFEGETPTDTVAAVLSKEPNYQTLPSELPQEIRDLLRRCLQKNASQRLRDIGDGRLELEEVLTTSGAKTSQASNDTNQAARKSRIIVLTATALLLAGIGSVALMVSRQIGEPAQNMLPPTNGSVVMQLTSYGGTEASGARSPDGRSLAFVSDHGGTPDIWLRQVSGGEPIRLTNDAAVESALAFSPAGDSIYFSRDANNGRAIWRIGALGGQAQKIIDDSGQPAPAPDGRQLAYIANEHGPGASGALIVSSVDGSQRRKLASQIVTVGAGPPSWSHDAHWIAYTRSPLFAPRNLFIVEVATGAERQVTHFTKSNEGIYSQAWLPDNRHLVVSYAPFTRGLSSDGDLGILDVNTGLVRRLTMNVADGFASLSLAADGKRLLTSYNASANEVWKVPLDSDPETNGRQAVELLDAAEDAFWLFVSRDGRMLLFNSGKSGSRNLWLMPLDKSTPAHQITTIPGNVVTHASLSPDDTRVAFASSAGGYSHIWTQNVDGSDLRQITDGASSDFWPVWSPDGNSIVFGSFLPNGRAECRVVTATGGSAEKLIDGGFRGDWMRQPSGTGSWIVSSLGDGIRLIDVEQRKVLWQDQRGDSLYSLPMFSPDGRTISFVEPDGRNRSAIWLFDPSTGQSRLGVRFPGPFRIDFRASWANDGRALIVNRVRGESHIVLFDHFWEAEIAR